MSARATELGKISASKRSAPASSNFDNRHQRRDSPATVGFTSRPDAGHDICLAAIERHLGLPNDDSPTDAPLNEQSVPAS
jgi:hypothetical protein